MKLTLALFLALTLTASAQQFSNIIIVIQENRTPDNLFGSASLPNTTCPIPGADVKIHGKGQSRPLAGGTDILHTYQEFQLEAGGFSPAGYYQYVRASYIQPYCQLAAQYGFANRMFQTNQGASYPSHQFLLSGTSSLSDSSDVLVSDNRDGDVKDISTDYGCSAKPTATVGTLAPDGTLGLVFPCFTRSSLLDLLVAQGLSWRYYAVCERCIWNAPASLTAYDKNANDVLSPPQILNDIANGNLANVSWVTPANLYSDHGGNNKGGGPAWVASIVNAVGNSPYWQNTAILVTWDDWGGWWDHVGTLANSTGWCANFCYGFRVPLLVISAQTPPGYVDNDVHDYGSILRFVESNFSLGLIGPGGWADAYADDLSGFFQGGAAKRPFVAIPARPLTQEELADQGEPDSD